MTPQVSLYALVAIWLLSMALGFKPGVDDRAGPAAAFSNIEEAGAPAPYSGVAETDLPASTHSMSNLPAYAAPR